VGIKRVSLKKQIKNFDWLDGQKVVTWVLEKLVSQVHQHAGYSLHNEEEEISYKKKKKNEEEEISLWYLMAKLILSKRSNLTGCVSMI
jgi:hypothetical protein